jgi:hypothetical protein
MTKQRKPLFTGTITTAAHGPEMPSPPTHPNDATSLVVFMFSAALGGIASYNIVLAILH